MARYRKISSHHVEFCQDELDAGEYADTVASDMMHIMGVMIANYEKTGIKEYEIIVRSKKSAGAP